MSRGAILLAGGRSRRMGADKAQLDWHGHTMAFHVAATLRSAVGGPVIVVGGAGRALPHLPPGVETAEDAHADNGPLEGLVAGLGAIGGRADAVFVCATDMPFMVASLIDRLHTTLRPTDDAVAVVDQGVLQPLAAVYRTRLLIAASERLDRNQRSLSGLLEAVSTRRLDAADLPPNERAALQSLDTPGTYVVALGDAAPEDS